MRSWLTERSRWLSLNEVRFGADLVRTRERDRTVWVPVQLQSPACLAHGIAGVGAKIHHHLMDLGRIGENRTYRIRQLEMQLDGRRQRGAEEGDGFLEEGGHGEGRTDAALDLLL